MSAIESVVRLLSPMGAEGHTSRSSLSAVGAVMAWPQWHAAISGRRPKLAKPLPKSVTCVPPSRAPPVGYNALG